MADRDQNGLVQALPVLDAASLLTLDTLEEGAPASAGYRRAERPGFLEASLSEVPADRPLLLSQHHPPFDTVIPVIDRIRLRNPEKESEVIACVRRLDYLFIGHVRRPVSRLWKGIPLHAQLRAIALGGAVL